jgi:hypothetical protein
MTNQELYRLCRDTWPEIGCRGLLRPALLKRALETLEKSATSSKSPPSDVISYDKDDQ